MPAPRAHQLDAFAMAVTQYLGHLRRRFRQRHNHGGLPVGGKAVTLERLHFPLRGDHALAGTMVRSAATNAVAPLEHLAVRLRHPQGHRVNPGNLFWLNDIAI